MADNSSEPSSQDHQSDQCTSDVFTSSDNSESNLGDFDSNSESDLNKSSSNMNHTFSSRSGGILHSPQLANNPFAVKTTTATKSLADSTENKEGRPIVAPATFTPIAINPDVDPIRGNCSSSSFKLKPAVLTNPFAKCDSVSERRNEMPEVSTSDEMALDSSMGKVAGCTSGHISSTLTPTSATHNHHHVINSGENHQHHHVSTTNCSVISQTSVAVNSGIPQPIVTPADASFVFGQNMNERVTQNVCNNCQNSSTSNGNLLLPSFGGSPELVEPETRREEKLANGEAAKCTAKSLHESAQEYESRKVKRTYDEVLVVTGEEEESNVLQLNCKLFTFDQKNSSWVERGRGLLRLNDKEESATEGALQSRLVMRTQGSLRVVLNTKVWAGMAIEQPSPRSVRLTAMDGDGVRVFLVMASAKDAEQLFNALNWRVKTLKSVEEQNQQQDRFPIDASCGGCVAASEDALHCQPSTTTSDDSSSSPKRRRVNEPDNQLDEEDDDDDDSASSEFGTNIQDTSIDSTSRNKSHTFEADSGNLSSSSL